MKQTQGNECSEYKGELIKNYLKRIFKKSGASVLHGHVLVHVHAYVRVCVRFHILFMFLYISVFMYVRYMVLCNYRDT